MVTRRSRKGHPVHRSRLGPEQLAAMIEEATVDAFNSSELATGWLTKIEEHLALPFATTALGIDLKVVKIDILPNDALVAICARGRQRQAIALSNLPLPEHPPAGSEWIEAYSRWLKDQA